MEMEYVKKCPQRPSFIQNGLSGYSYDIRTKLVSIDIEDVHKGHDRYYKNLISTTIYYVISGLGIFKINGELYDVQEGDVVEIPANTEFVFAGEMKLLVVMTPPFNASNGVSGADNDLYIEGNV